MGLELYREFKELGFVDHTLGDSLGIVFASLDYNHGLRNCFSVI